MFLYILLSACLLVSSVTPSLAQAIKPTSFRGVANAGKKLPRLVRSELTRVPNSKPLERLPKHLQSSVQSQAGLSKGTSQVVTSSKAGTLGGKEPANAIISQTFQRFPTILTLTPQEQMRYVEENILSVIFGTDIVPSTAQMLWLELTLREVVQAEAPLALQERALLDLAIVSGSEQAVLDVLQEFVNQLPRSLWSETDRVAIMVCLMLGEPGIMYLRELAAQRQAAGFKGGRAWERVKEVAPDITLPIIAWGNELPKEEVESLQAARQYVQGKLDAANKVVAQEGARQDVISQLTGHSATPMAESSEPQLTETTNLEPAQEGNENVEANETSLSAGATTVADGSIPAVRSNQVQSVSSKLTNAFKAKQENRARKRTQAYGKKLLKKAEQFVETHERWYEANSKEYRKIYTFCKSYPNLRITRELNDLKKTVREIETQNREQKQNADTPKRGAKLVKKAKQFVEKNRRWYKATSSEYAAIATFCRRYPNSPFAQELENLKKTAQKTEIEQRGQKLYNAALAYTQKTGRWYKTDSSQANSVGYFVKKYKDLPIASTIIALRSQYTGRQFQEVMPEEETVLGNELLNEAKQFVEENGKWPNASSDLYHRIARFCNRHDSPITEALNALKKTAQETKIENRGQKLYAEASSYVQNTGSWYPIKTTQYMTVQRFVSAQPDLPIAKKLKQLWKKYSPGRGGVRIHSAQKEAPVSLKSDDQPSPAQTPSTIDKSKRTPRPRISQKSVYSSSPINVSAHSQLTNWLDIHAEHIIYTQQTKQALRSLAKMPDKEIKDIVQNLTRMPLGKQVDSYNLVVFRGKNPFQPHLDDFYLVNEVNGLPRDLFALAEEMQADLLPHIKFSKRQRNGKEVLLRVQLQEGVSPQEINDLIVSLRHGSKWDIRMGKHELGLVRDEQTGELVFGKETRRGYIHMHFTQSGQPRTNGNIEICYSLKIDLRSLLPGGKDLVQNPERQLWKTLQRYFGPLFTERMQPDF